MNDSHVSSSSLKSVLNKQAYVLFYSKIQQPPLTYNGNALCSATLSTSLGHSGTNSPFTVVTSLQTHFDKDNTNSLQGSNIEENSNLSQNQTLKKSALAVQTVDTSSLVSGPKMEQKLQDLEARTTFLQDNINNVEDFVQKSRGLRSICSWEIKPFR